MISNDNELLNQKFQNKNLLFKNLALLLLVIRKFPRLIISLRKKTTYTKGGQTFDMFRFVFGYGTSGIANFSIIIKKIH